MIGFIAGLERKAFFSAAKENGLTTLTFAAICRDDLEEPTADGRTERWGIAYEELIPLTIHMTQKAFEKIENVERSMNELNKENNEDIVLAESDWTAIHVHRGTAGENSRKGDRNMLSQSTKKVTITASSIVETEEKKVVLENYTATVDSENPENLSMNKFFPDHRIKKICIKTTGRSAGKIMRRSRKKRMPSRMRCLLCLKNKR